MSDKSTGTATAAATHTEPFRYASTGTVLNEISDNKPYSERTDSSAPGGNAELSEKAAYERGVQDGAAHVRVSCDQQISTVRASVTSALDSFVAQRESYFNRVEPEIVQLALAIARKILHREAQMDPLLLTGMVHVALEKIDSSTRVRLRVHPADIQKWNEYFSLSGKSPMNPELLGDPTLQHGECALETEIGSTQISLDNQLKEIEQGFFDLLGQRPQVR